QLLAWRFGRTEAVARAVAFPGGGEDDRGWITRELVNQAGEIENRGLDARGDIVGLANAAAQGAGDQTVHNILDKDEFAGGDTTVFDRQRFVPQGFPDRCGCLVARLDLYRSGSLFGLV